MPRPHLELIDVGYRKIPIMAIGKDIYIDSRLIISKLEALYPDSTLTPTTLAQAGIRKLFENWTIDGGIFANAMKLCTLLARSRLSIQQSLCSRP
jgi:glutathione S-transferase